MLILLQSRTSHWNEKVTEKKATHYSSFKILVMAKYSKKAQDKVEEVMHEKKQGTLKSGGSGKKVTSNKQAIAIGLSEARKAGAKVPAKKGATKKSAAKKAAPKKAATKKSAPKKAAPRKSATKKSAAPRKAATKKAASGKKPGPKKGS